MHARILIADDHDLMRSLLRQLLNSHDGWEVCCEARNGGEAVAKASDLHPDVIILDLSMPAMNGFQAAREILKKTPHPFVLLFTLHHSPELEQQAALLGIHRVISKPDDAALLSAIEELLVSSDQHPGPNPPPEPLEDRPALHGAKFRGSLLT